MTPTPEPRYLFIGERPSARATSMRVSWRDGRLAAKQLFDALLTVGVNPLAQRYTNLFEATLDKPERVSIQALRRTRYALRRGLVVIAMGWKVEAVLRLKGIPCTAIVHPAARGKIRKKARYADHLRERLLPFPGVEQWPQNP